MMSSWFKSLAHAIRLLLVLGLGCSPPSYRPTPAPDSDFLYGWLSWDENAQAVFRIALSLPEAEFVAPSESDARAPDRLVLTASVLDASGKNIGGRAWTYDIDLPLPQATQFERQVALPAPPGGVELAIGVIWRGRQLLPEWRRPFSIPAAAPDLLVLGEPQFLRPSQQESGSEALQRINPGRYYEDEGGPVRVQLTVYDPRPMVTTGVWTLRYEVEDREGRSILQSTRDLLRSGAVSSFEIELPTIPLGSYELRLEVQAGERKAMSSGRFEIGFGDLAALGDVEGGLDLLQFLMPPEEFEELRQAPPEERGSLWKKYWDTHDPEPSTPNNEYRDELLRRIRYANSRFSTSESGWRTDRGRVYIRFGPPDERVPLQNPEAFDSLERWTYYDGNKVFVFRDRDGSGNYRLIRSNVDSSWLETGSSGRE